MDKEFFERQRKEYYKNLCEQEWNGKKIWEHIRDLSLSSTPAFEGLYYKEAKTKIMFVGRALNGWEEPYNDCSTLENTVDSILNQKDALDTFVNPEGYPGDKKRYYHKNQKFFRFIKHILEQIGESDTPLEETWYKDSKYWNQKFVWANLYCIAPRHPNPGENSNPQDLMIKPSIETYVQLMKLYIEFYEPDVVIFITDVPGWFVKWKRKKSFKDMLDEYKECQNSFIAAKGKLGKSKIIVCRRPDPIAKKGATFGWVEEKAKEVISEI